MRKHVNIPIFIPHLGCKNQCVFCNQRSISGVNEFDKTKVRDIIEDALATVDDSAYVEIAFFGGSFTGIDRELMIYLLETAHSYVRDGKVNSIRCSTRPDYIDVQILDILSRYGVKVIELGLQSSDDLVLSACKRGHGFESAVNACKLIVDRGFELVGQMMIGLPDSTPEKEMKTADFIISQGATSARIYPTVVFRDTELCEMSTQGLYTPISLEDAVKRSAAVMKRFIDSGVGVIRVGLHSSENLQSEKTYFDGPNHPALGELVINEIYYQIMYEELKKNNFFEICDVKIFVGKGCLSKAIGQKKRNIIQLKKDFPTLNIIVSESSLISEYSIKVER